MDSKMVWIPVMFDEASARCLWCLTIAHMRTGTARYPLRWQWGRRAGSSEGEGLRRARQLTQQQRPQQQRSQTRQFQMG